MKYLRIHNIGIHIKCQEEFSLILGKTDGKMERRKDGVFCEMQKNLRS